LLAAPAQLTALPADCLLAAYTFVAGLLGEAIRYTEDLGDAPKPQDPEQPLGGDVDAVDFSVSWWRHP
jgi:hypothetical protein